MAYGHELLQNSLFLSGALHRDREGKWIGHHVDTSCGNKKDLALISVQDETLPRAVETAILGCQYRYQRPEQ